ncbi:MAG: M20 family metallopeptidase [Clostridia bacterium]|nr:M20 family metallopeptidase [Clostridia bacterium]
MDYQALVARLEGELAPELEAISHYLYENPELGLKEHLAADYLSDWMEKQGFAVERPWHGMDTAFAAHWGEEGPCVAFLAEYDALPGYGPQGCDPGHACGHNWIAATCAGAAVVFKQVCEQTGLKARILLAGCPAEETFGSKSLLAREGAFAGVDLAMQAHLSEETNIYHRSLALTALEIRYFGKAAHASAAPWEGINALDAIQLFYAGVSALRQQMKPDVRLHGVIREGGLAANSIPERASCLYYARAARRQDLDRVVERLRDVAKGASLMTGARLEITQAEQPMDDIVRLPALQQLFDELLRKEGLVTITPEQEAARSVGSTDVGNVSHICPTIFVEVGLDGFYGHTEEALALADDKAYPVLHSTVRVLTQAALQAASDSNLRENLWTQWRERI